MYQSSVAFGNLIQQDSRTFRAQITLGDNSITEGIRSIKINGGSNSEDDFSLGSAVSQYVEIDIAAPDIQFEGHEFLLELGIVVNDSVEEYVPMGYFTAEKPEGDEEQVSIVAYDRMVKTERPCFLSLSDQTNTIDVLKAVGAITGVPVVTEGLASISMQKPVGYTCREVLSYVAQLYGGFAVCNRQGQIEIKTYEDHGYTVGTGRYWDTFTHNDLAYSLEKITCYTGKDESGENISITVGEGMRGISISNPFMTQAALNNVWTSLNNYTYMPGNFRFLGDPRIDPWDILTVEDRNGKSYKVPAMKLTQDYDGGLSTEVEAVGKSEAEQESGFQGPMTQQMERYYAQLVLIDHAMVDKLDAETARITYATIENLEAVNATIETLDVTKLTARVAIIENAYIARAEVNTLLADYASVAQLNAVNAQVTNISGELSTYKTQIAGQLTAFDADITSLKAKDAELETALIGTAKVTDLEAIRARTQQLETDVAGINTLVNGNLTSDNIQSMVITGDKFTMENGFIKSAMIDSLAADKITGLDINTTKLTVHSNDGKSTWTDNTIQIADADRVRVQIGEDASGDYNIYIWDPSGNLMWNATGATSAGLNDGIIKDVAVAADANISGNKLDIESVIREVNGATTTIKGTRIKLDEQNQTLDAAFTSLKTYAEGVNSKTESNTTAISVAQGQISTLISNTTIVKDGQTVQLKDAFNSTVADVSSIKTTLNEHTSLIDQQSGEILAVTTKANTIESDLNGTKQTVSAVQSDLSGTKSRVATVETGLDGLKSRVTATETSLSKKADGTTVDSLTSRVATAESTINGFQVSLTATNKTVSDNYTALNSKIDGIEIGGRNLLPKSKMGKTTAISSNSLSGYGYTKGLVNTNIAGQTAVLRLKSSTNYVISFTAWCGANTQQMNVDLYPDTLPEKVFTLTTTPTRYAFSVYSNNADMPNGYLRFFRANGFTENVYITDILVEQGTKASQTWTPAPEDADSILNAHTEQLSTHDTRITANENAISLKVSTSDYNAYKTTVNNELTSAKSRLSTAESSITAMQGQIALKVSQTDIDTAVGNIQVGGRNLASASKIGYNGSKPTKNGYEYTQNVGSGYGLRFSSTLFEIGKSYVLSFKFQKLSTDITLTYMGGHCAGFATKKIVINGQVTTGVNFYSGVPISDSSEIQTCEVCLIYNGNTSDNNLYIQPQRGSYHSSNDIQIKYWDIQIEKGNKSTDWTPAPEDIDASINAVDAKFVNYSTTTQMTAAITAAKDSITQSVSSTYATKASVDTVSGNVTNLTSRVQTAESKLTKDGLTTIVGDYYTTASYVGSAIDGIEIGGRNLVANTAPASVTGWVSLAGWTLSLVDCARAPYGKAVRATNGSATSGGVYKPPIDYTKMVNGQKYTISAWIRASKVCTLNFKNEMMPSNNAINVTTSWQKYTFTSAINTGASHHSNVFYVTSGIANGMWIEIHSLKLEKGTKATDWEPAPEDIDASIASVQAIATQAADKFNWLVKSGTSSTNFELTDRTATLVANAINLKGLVTFSGLDSAAQGKINTIDSINSFKFFTSNYSQSQSTLDSWAVEGKDAGSWTVVEGTAGVRVGDMAAIRCYNTTTSAYVYILIKVTAILSATALRGISHGYIDPNATAAAATAQSTANTANTTANTAKTNAATAQSTANTAKTNAATAQSTADAANSTLADWSYDKDKTYINGGKIYAGTVTAAQIAANAITAAKIATDAIKSRNYAYLSGDYSTAGTFFDLSNGAIRSKNFAIKSDGQRRT